MKLRSMSLVLAGLMLAGISTPAPAGIKCWTNSEGVRECGNAVPPEYAQKGHQEISKSGIRVTEHQGAKSPEELEAERIRQKQEAERRQIAKEKRAKQLAQDQVLRRTFSSEDELTLARDGKIAVIESRIKLAENRTGRLQANLEKLQDQAAQQERAGKAVSDKLAKEIDRAKRRLDDNLAYIQARRKDQDNLRSQFDADLARFRALMSGQVKPGQI